MLDQALARIQQTGKMIDQAEILRLKEKLLLMCDGAVTAERNIVFGPSKSPARRSGGSCAQR